LSRNDGSVSISVVRIRYSSSYTSYGERSILSMHRPIGLRVLATRSARATRPSDLYALWSPLINPKQDPDGPESTVVFNLKMAVKGDRNGAGAQNPKRFWADAPFSIPQLPFLGLSPRKPVTV
jgi:hypothetical protein